MRRAPPPSLTLTTVPPRPPSQWLHERLGDGERSAFELRVPGRKGKPAQVIAYGSIATAPSNTAPERTARDTSVVVDCGPLLGHVVVRPKRYKRADGTRGPAIAVKVNGASRDRPNLDSERSARSDVEQALRKLDKGGRDVRLALAPTVRLARSQCGLLATIPDKGKPEKWANVDALVWALARRMVR